MTGNEYLARDIHSLQRIHAGLTKEVGDLREEKAILLKNIKEEPNNVVVDLDAQIAVRTKARDALDAEILVQKEVLAKVQKDSMNTSQALSEVTKKHQENAKNAVLREQVAQEGLERVKNERISHDKAVAVSRAQRDALLEEVAATEQLKFRAHLETQTAMQERDAMLAEMETIRVSLERYRSDKLNLEEWDRRLQDKEAYLLEFATQMGVDLDKLLS